MNQPTVSPKIKTASRRNVLLATLVLAVVLAGLGWTYVVSHAPAIIKDKVLEQAGEMLDGTVTVGSLDVSLSGTVLAHQVAVYDHSGTKIGQAEQIRMDVSVDDLLSRRFDLQALKKITLENPGIVLSQTDGRWNWENIVKNKTDKPLAFRGQIIVNQAAMEMSGPAVGKMEAVTGRFDFVSYPTIAVSLTGRKGTIPFSAKGTWSVSGDGDMVVQADKVPLDGIMPDALTQAGIADRSGSFDKLSFTISKKAGAYKITGEGIVTGRQGTIPFNAKGTWSESGDGDMVVQAERVPLDGVKSDTLTSAGVAVRSGSFDRLSLTISKKAGAYMFAGEGNVTDLEGTAAGYDVSQGSGTVAFDAVKAVFTNATMRLNGQRLSLDGTIALDNNMELDCNVSADSFDPTVLAGPSLQGIMAFQAKVQGTALQPQASGRFMIPEGALSTLRFSAADGAFTYAGGILTLHDAQAAIWSGAVGLNGTVWPSEQRFDLAMVGRDIDSALLTDKDISGRVSFQAAVTGRGTSNLTAHGTFRMGEGKFYGLPFLSMDGDFTKQGEQTDFTNIIVYTVGGSFGATGFTEGSVVRLQKQEMVLENPVEKVKEKINEKINETLANKLKGLFSQ